jgi:probable F420-dependent oxidoreductase
LHLAILPPYRTGVTADPVWMSTFARHAEDAGFESLYVVEHTVVIVGYDERYPYSANGRMPLPDDVDIPDPIDLLAFLAAHTERLRLATGVVVLPEHHPVVLAKRLATVDQLSGGRITLGVGVGWMQEELDAVGIDFSTRGRRTDECIDALRSLWRHDEASFNGEFFHFERARSHPKPVQPGGVPIHVGGHSEAAARRAGRRGDGYHPIGLDEETLARRLVVVREAAHAEGRDPAAIELSMGGLLDAVDDAAIERARALGATRLILSSRSDDLATLQEQVQRAAAVREANV